MTEIAYDLYGGGYVEGNWTKEEEARREAERERRAWLDLYGFPFVAFWDLDVVFYPEVNPEPEPPRTLRERELAHRIALAGGPQPWKGKRRG